MTFQQFGIGILRLQDFYGEYKYPDASMKEMFAEFGHCSIEKWLKVVNRVFAVYPNPRMTIGADKIGKIFAQIVDEEQEKNHQKNNSNLKYTDMGPQELSSFFKGLIDEHVEVKITKENKANPPMFRIEGEKNV